MLRIARHLGSEGTSLLVNRVADSHLSLTSSMVKSRLQNSASWYMPYYDTEVENNHALEQKEYYRGRK